MGESHPAITISVPTVEEESTSCTIGTVVKSGERKRTGVQKCEPARAAGNQEVH